MISPSTIYWVTRCDAIRGVASVYSFIGGLALAGALAFFIASRMCNDLRTRRRLAAWLLVAALLPEICAVGSLAFVPTTREMAAILVIPAVVNNQDVQALGSELPRLAREWIDELRPEGKREAAQ